jgi:hypothetical protein
LLPTGQRGPKDPASWTVGARPISPQHLAYLRILVAHVGSVRAVSRFLKTSPEVVADALTCAIFRAKGAEAIEGRIAALHRGLEQDAVAANGERPRSDAS